MVKSRGTRMLLGGLTVVALLGIAAGWWLFAKRVGGGPTEDACATAWRVASAESTPKALRRFVVQSSRCAEAGLARDKLAASAADAWNKHPRPLSVEACRSAADSFCDTPIGSNIERECEPLALQSAPEPLTERYLIEFQAAYPDSNHLGELFSRYWKDTRQARSRRLIALAPAESLKPLIDSLPNLPGGVRWRTIKELRRRHPLWWLRTLPAEMEGQIMKAIVDTMKSSRPTGAGETPTKCLLAERLADVGDPQYAQALVGLLAEDERCESIALEGLTRIGFRDTTGEIQAYLEGHPQWSSAKGLNKMKVLALLERRRAIDQATTWTLQDADDYAAGWLCSRCRARCLDVLDVALNAAAVPMGETTVPVDEAVQVNRTSLRHKAKYFARIRARLGRTETSDSSAEDGALAYEQALSSAEKDLRLATWGGKALFQHDKTAESVVRHALVADGQGMDAKRYLALLFATGWRPASWRDVYLVLSLDDPWGGRSDDGDSGWSLPDKVLLSVLWPHFEPIVVEDLKATDHDKYLRAISTVIMRGDSRFLPSLVQLLEKWSTVTIANRLLDSGNVELVQATLDWAKVHTVVLKRGNDTIDLATANAGVLAKESVGSVRWGSLPR